MRLPSATTTKYLVNPLSEPMVSKLASLLWISEPAQPAICIKDDERKAGVRDLPSPSSHTQTYDNTRKWTTHTTLKLLCSLVETKLRQQRALCTSTHSTGGGAGKARFNVATPTYEARTRPLHVQHTYYRIIFKQNPFNIISRGVQR